MSREIIFLSVEKAVSDIPAPEAGASLSLDGKDFYYGVLIPVSEIRLCLDEWNRQE